MKIVTIPHPTLRQTAKIVLDFGTPLQDFLAEMGKTLQTTTNPQGVGLAAPQVNTPLRVFLTALEDAPIAPRAFINPHITSHSKKYTFGPDPENPRLEGCLSMPGLYGPVPRWEWVQVEYQALINGQVAEKKERFDGFHARVVQHEIDHLDGILFTDYSLQYDLPVYREQGKDLVEITDRGALELY